MSDAGLPGDPRFFGTATPRSLRELAQAAGATVADADAERLIAGVAPLQIAEARHVSFLDNRKYAPDLAASRAGAVIVKAEMAATVPAGCVALITPEPYLAWARVAALFHRPPPARPGVHPMAFVDPSARVDPSAEIGPFAVVGALAEIGPRCVLGAHAAVGAGVVIGADSRIGTHVSVSHAIIGARVTLFPGARIGQDGFGFATGPAGFETVPQIGRVLIGDDAEIGANSTVDRGSMQDTVIGPGCRIDNLVQIGHNVRLGRCCVLVGLVGISGSTVLEDFVVVAGQAGVAGHLRVGRGAKIGAKAGVMHDVPAGTDILGAPGIPAKEYFRQIVALKRLATRPMRKADTD